MSDSQSSHNTNDNESDRLLVFSDDWGRHPSSCQHLIRQILPRVPVTWVNTIGMRPPRLDWLTVRRGAGKIAGWMKPAAKNGAASASLPNGLSVVDAKMWPWMSRPHDRWINRQLLASQLSVVAQDRVAISTIPIVVDWFDILPARRWVYYCVDDFSVWPGLDQKTMLRMEAELIDKVDRIVVVSEVLQQRISALGRESTLITHGIEPDVWGSDCVEPYVWPCGVESPVALFWGVIDRRMDVDWIVELSHRVVDLNIVLVGPQQDADLRLRSAPNVHILDAVDACVLPRMARAADCLIMPYIDAEVTRAMQPLKLKEYLATGRPVIARSLPATREWADCLDLATNVDEFCDAVQQGTEVGVADEQTQSRDRLAGETWASKAAAFREAIQ